MDAGNITTTTATDLADYLGVTPRRVRQLAEEGRLRKRGRGTFDMSHALLVNIGTRRMGQDRARRLSVDVLAAVGWLSGFALGQEEIPITGEDLAAWRAMVARWGLSEDDATALLVAGAAQMGERAPAFKAGAGS